MPTRWDEEWGPYITSTAWDSKGGQARSFLKANTSIREAETRAKH